MMNEEKWLSRNNGSVRNPAYVFVEINIFLPTRHFYGKECIFNFLVYTVRRGLQCMLFQGGEFKSRFLPLFLLGHE